MAQAQAPAPAPAPLEAAPLEAADTPLTLAEVALHNTPEDAWIAVYDKVRWDQSRGVQRRREADAVVQTRGARISDTAAATN